MKTKLKKILAAPWYVFLFAVYPPLALLAYNIDEVRPLQGLRSIGIALLAAWLLTALFRLLFHSRQRAALLVSILLLFFFSYGDVLTLATRQWHLPALTWIIPCLWLLLAVVAVAWLARRQTRVRRAAPILNLLALALTLVAFGQVVVVSLPRSRSAVAEHAPVQTLTLPSGQQPPDIYYIIVDSYGRSDLLARSFKIDNSAFIQDLEALGFTIPECSQSNYNRTDVSLASSLNMTYLQDLDDAFLPPSQARRKLWDSIIHSTVRADLENAGYRTVAFSTGFPWTEFTDADVYLEPVQPWSQVNSFETLLLGTTPLRHLPAAGSVGLPAAVSNGLDELDGRQFKQRTELIFDSMDELAAMPGPKFVFIHIIPPHPPFIYASDGTWTDPAPFLNENGLYTGSSYKEGYRSQLAFINSRLIPALRTLLEESPTDPVIILQGDHAPWLQSGSGKFMILNAYHLPGQADLPYAGISPVNTFRLVLDTYLGAEYPLLEDISYYSPTPNIYEFEAFPNPCLEP